MQASKYASSIVSPSLVSPESTLFFHLLSPILRFDRSNRFLDRLDDFRPIKYGIMENGKWSREWKRSSCGGNGCWILENWNFPFAKLVLFNVAEYAVSLYVAFLLFSSLPLFSLYSFLIFILGGDGGIRAPLQNSVEFRRRKNSNL